MEAMSGEDTRSRGPTKIKKSEGFVRENVTGEEEEENADTLKSISFWFIGYPNESGCNRHYITLVCFFTGKHFKLYVSSHRNEEIDEQKLDPKEGESSFSQLWSRITLPLPHDSRRSTRHQEIFY